MKVFPIISIITAGLFFSGCNTQIEDSSFSAEVKAKVRQETVNMLNEYQDQIAVRGLMAEFDYLDSTSDFFWVPPGYDHSLDYDSVAIIIRKNAASLKQVSNKWVKLNVNPLSKEFATYNGTLYSKVTTIEGIETEYSLIETGILIRRKEGWKILSGQTSMIENHSQLPDSITRH